MKESSYDYLKRKRRSSLESLILTAIVFFLLFSVNANSQELGVLEVSKNEMYCQVLNSDLDCQLIDNQLSVSIGGYVENLEADLDLVCEGEHVETYASECNRTENLYKCYFDIEPTITLESPKDCEMTFYFYKKFLDESIGSDKYEGSLKIIPLFETSLLNLEKQKTKLKKDFSIVKVFDKESTYNSGICSYLGTSILFGDVSKYENDFKNLGGTLIPTATVAGRSLNLLKASSVLASTYAGDGDPFLPLLLYHLLFQGLLTGDFISDIIYQLSEGYLWGDIFVNLENDVYGSCEKMEWDFDHVLNPNFILMGKVKLIDCLEKRDYKNCWKRLEDMESYVNPGNIPERTELRFYLEGYLLRDRSNVCEGNEIKIAYNNLERFGVDHLNVTGPGELTACEKTISVSGDGDKTFPVSEFLCDQEEPVDGGTYAIGIDPGTLGEKVTYRFNYYEDQEKCKVQQVVIPV